MLLRKALNPEVAPGAHLQKLSQPIRTKCPTSSSGCDCLVHLNDGLLDTGCTNNNTGSDLDKTCPPNLVFVWARVCLCVCACVCVCVCV